MADHSRSTLYVYGLTQTLLLSSLCRDKIALRTSCSLIFEKLSERCGRFMVEDLIVEVVFFEEFLDPDFACSSFNSYSKTLSMFRVYSLRSAKTLAFLSFLKNKNGDIEIPVTKEGLSLKMKLYPETFWSDYGYKDPSHTMNENDIENLPEDDDFEQ